MKTPLADLRKKVICSDHFEGHCFYNPNDRDSSSMRRDIAYPTLNLPTTISPIKPRRPLKRRIVSPVAGQHSQSISNVNDLHIHLVIAADDDDNESLYDGKENLAMDANNEPQGDAKKIDALKLKVKRLQSSKFKAKIRKNKLSSANRSLKLQLKEAHKALSKATQELSGTGLEATGLSFFKAQLQATKVAKRGMRWTTDLKGLCLSVYFRSPAAYAQFGSVFRLPTKETILRPIRNILQGAGYCPQILSVLASKLATLPERDRLACLIFDGMTVKKAVSYKEDKDQLVGLVDTGLHQEDIRDVNRPADQLFAIVVRGVLRKWKQVVGYCLVDHGLSAAELRSIINEGLMQTNKSGIRVVSIVCDMDTQQQRCIREFGVSEEQPYIEHVVTGEPVFLMYDPPHLMKCIRNNLVNNDFEFPSGTAKWSHLLKLWEIESTRPIRMVPKLKSVHFLLPLGKKMRVDLAVQIFSHSMAAGIRAMVANEELEAEALETADFVSFVNDLWDIFNCNSMKAQSKKRAIHKGSLQFRLTDLRTAREQITQWRFLDTRPSAKVVHRESIPFKQCLVQTIAAYEGVLELLISDLGVPFVCGRRFNQDCVENTFAQVRRDKGSFYEMQEPWRAVANLRCVAGNMFLQPLYKTGTNCKNDADSILFNVNELPVRSIKKSVHGDVWSQSAEVASRVPAPALVRTSHRLAGKKTSMKAENKKVARARKQHVDTLPKSELDIIQYIAGHIVLRLQNASRRRVTCSDCLASLLSSNKDQRPFMEHKTYKYVVTGLTTPSADLLQCVHQWEIFFRPCFRQHRNEKDLMQQIRSQISRRTDMSFIPACHRDDVSSRLLSMFLRIRIHQEARLITEKLKEERRRSLRKFSKVGGIRSKACTKE